MKLEIEKLSVKGSPALPTPAADKAMETYLLDSIAWLDEMENI